MAKSPSPPPPTIPTVAVSPTRLTMVIVVTRMMAGMLSRRYTCQIICQVDMPMDSAASMYPGSRPARADSICLEKKGVIPTTRGKMAPLGPMAVPINSLVNGTRAAARMMKGMDLNKSISLSRTLKTRPLRLMPLRRVTIRPTPIIRDRTKEMTPDTPTMTRVWTRLSKNSGSRLITLGNQAVSNDVMT